jgi:hypothetical protein
MKTYITVILALLLSVTPGHIIGEENVAASTTIQIRPTGIFPDDRNTVQAAIDAGDDEIVLMAETIDGVRVDWNFGGPPEATYTPDGFILPGADQVNARTFGINTDVIPDTISQNLIIRGETLSGTDEDGDPDYVVLNGAALWHSWTSGGFTVSFPHENGGSYNLTVKNLHFKNSPGAAMGFGSNGDVLIENCKISSPKQVYFFGGAFLIPIMSWGSLERFGIPNANNWWEVFPKGSFTVRNCLVDATMEYGWYDLIHVPGNPDSIWFQWEVGIQMQRIMNSEILIENNIVKNASVTGISISNPIIPLNDTRPTRSVTVRNNTVYTNDYGPDEISWWFVGDCNPDAGTGWEPATMGIDVSLSDFPLATAMPVTIELNNVITKGYQDTGIQVFGPVNGLVISKNTLDCGPSDFAGLDGYDAKVCIMITSMKCPSTPLGDPIEDADGYGAQNILVEKNKLRGTVTAGISVRDWTLFAAPAQPRTAFTDVRLVKNQHQFLDHSAATYYFSDTTHDCFLRAKPPIENLVILDDGTNNVIVIPNEDD